MRAVRTPTISAPGSGAAALAAPLAAPLAIVAGTGVATYSVVRYRPAIVLTYTALVIALGWWQVHRPASARGRATAAVAGTATGAGLAAALALAAVLHVRVWAYSYTALPERAQIRWLFAGAAGLAALTLATAAVLLARARPEADATEVRGDRARLLADVAFGIGAVAYLVGAVLLIRWDPAPKIDVWVMLQQATEGIRHGQNIYTMNWTGSPGVQNAFTYLPFMALLLAPARWLAGDVRWGLVAFTLAGALAVRLLAGRRATPSAVLAAAGAATLLLLLPGTSAQIEQAWTEPLLMACLAGWALGVQRNNTVLAVACLALGLASKQHLVLLLPLLAVWPRFGWRRTLASAGLAGLFVLPWFIASPPDLWHDSVSVLVSFQPLIFADTLYIAAINDLHWTPPFWLTGAAVLGTWALAVVLIGRREPGLATVLRWGALVLFVANLVNKQAFYNQYWLVAAMVVLSLAVPAAVDPGLEEPTYAVDDGSAEPSSPPKAVGPRS